MTVPESMCPASSVGCRAFQSRATLLFFKQKTGYEMPKWLEFRRVLFRSHPRPERNLLALQSPRIAGSIKSLLMGVDNFGSLGQEWNLLQYLIAVEAVLPHNRHFVGRQLVRLAQNVVGNRHLPNIVEKRAAGDHA